MIAVALILASCAVALSLGLAHLLFTFSGKQLRPRDDSLVAAMDAVHPVLTRETTIWRCWIGFNASHSLGPILFGLFYGYLALAQREMLFHSAFLLTLGFITLLSYVLLARRYWFSTPFRGVSTALLLYTAGAALALS